MIHEARESPRGAPSEESPQAYVDRLFAEAAAAPYVAPRLGKYARGEHHPRTRLLTEQVHEIRRRVAQGEFMKTLAREFGVSAATVRRIAQGTTWRHLIAPTTAPAGAESSNKQHQPEV